MPRDPQQLGQVVSELIQLRGLGRVQANEQLAQIWRDVAGETFARQTKVIGICRGALQIGVASSPLLSELVSFHQSTLLDALQNKHPHLKVRKLQFRLRGDLNLL